MRGQTTPRPRRRPPTSRSSLSVTFALMGPLRKMWPTRHSSCRFSIRSGTTPQDPSRRSCFSYFLFWVGGLKRLLLNRSERRNGRDFLRFQLFRLLLGLAIAVPATFGHVALVLPKMPKANGRRVRTQFDTRAATDRSFVTVMRLDGNHLASYGIVGDKGPTNELGEASVAMNAELNGLPVGDIPSSSQRKCWLCHVVENWMRLRRNLQLKSGRGDGFVPRLQGRCPEGSVRSC